MEYPWAERRLFTIDHPSPDLGPFFESRILVREGQLIGLPRDAKGWATRAAGIRVYLEGFRVLPYGEPNNDWLSIDLDYTLRGRTLPWLDESELQVARDEDKDVGLVKLRNSSYFGAVFLTEADAGFLRILVNREGFVPDAALDSLVLLVRRGVDLSTRVRAAASFEERNERRRLRASGSHDREQQSKPQGLGSKRLVFEASISRAASLAEEARQLVGVGDLSAAAERIDHVVIELGHVERVSREYISEGTMLRILASVGTQMAAFVHEINGLLGTTQAIDSTLGRMRDDRHLSPGFRTELAKLHSVVGDLRRNLERQATYLLDVVTPDSRRRRQRLSLYERFEAGARLVAHQVQRRSISILDRIPHDLKSPPMFPAELTTVFSNLLTNAVKAAEQGGEISAWASCQEDGRIRLVVENTGVQVDPKQGEQWFKPFESTTDAVDPVLGQGMGLGLPITRSILEEYGAEIRFVRPSPGYSTAVEIVFPK